ncbi:MAG: GAF domain-containing protein [Anaerolineales bacterium]|nr:GAF domain-containing protein [Anaerolineales bacterium]
MNWMDPGTLGITVTLIALAFLVVVVVFIRFVPRIQPFTKPPESPPTNVEISQTNEAVLMVEIGGRVAYTNKMARDWFGHLEEEPNLERLARRTRPSEVFWGLCSSEGQARFSLDGRFIEGTSYYLPPSNGTVGAFLVTLRRPQVSAITGSEAQLSDHALDIFSELSQAMASSLDLDRTLYTILESVERLIPSDFPEITVWDSTNRHLVPYRFVGMPGIDRHLEKSLDRYLPGKGYSGYLILNQKPLLITDVDTYRNVRPVVDRKQYPFSSYMGYPLLVAGKLVGTLELASLSKSAFTPADLEILRILSGQAAVALNNALLFNQEQQRILELSGLAKLAQASGAAQSVQDFFSRLVESITPLMDVRTIGFLIYDESRRHLRAQAPFVGIPTDFVPLYAVTIPPGTPAEQEWLSQEMIASENAPQDAHLEALGLAHLAQATGIQNTILTPLTSGGRMLGYLQVADKSDGSPFDQDDIRMLTIIAGQAAAIVENATLIKQSQDRAQRSEAMRRIASLTGSVATLDEILAFSLRELARLLRADVGAIYLIDENRDSLRLHKDSTYGASSELPARLMRVSMSDPEFRATVTATRRPFFTDDVNQEAVLLSIYKPLAETWQMKAMLSVPIVVRDRGIGEIVLASRQQEFFNRSDLTQVATTASQLATAIEKSTLYTQTDESLRRRVDQLLALTRISREMNTSLVLDSVLKLVYDELIHTTRASCGYIILFELSDERVISSKAMLHIGDPPSGELTPIERLVVEHEEAIIVDNYAQPDAELNVPSLTPPHTGVVSSMVVPITFQESVAGLIHMHSRIPGRFDATALEIAQSLATQAAIALGNALRYREQVLRSELLSRRVETMSKLLEASRALSPDQPLEDAMEAIAYGIQESTPFNVVLVSVYDKKTENLRRVAGAGLPLETMEEFRRRAQPWAGIVQMLEPQFRFSRSYFIPSEQRPVTVADIHTMTIMPLDLSQVDDTMAWNPQDLLIVPLTTASGEPLGLVSVDAPRNNLRPDRPTIEALEVFATQAELSIESHQRLSELSATSAVLQRELMLAQDALGASQSQFPNLLHKDVELTLTVQRLNRRARWIQAGLDIAEIVSRQSDRLDVLLSFGRELMIRLDLSMTLIAESGPGGPHLLHVLGSRSSTINLETLLGQRNPLRSVLQSGEQLLVANLDENSDWNTSPLLNALEAKAFFCLPIVVAMRVDAVVLALSQVPLPPLSEDDAHLYALMCRQVAIALENLRLLTETNRRLQEVNLLLEFSRKLGTLDPVSILRTLVESALQVLPAAHAGMVAIWEPEQRRLRPQAALGYINSHRILEITYDMGQALPGQAFERGEILRVPEVNFARDYNLSPESLVIYRDATEGRLPISCLVVPLQTGDNRLGVLVLDNFRSADAFTADDQALIASLAHQTALTLENARLYQASEQRAAQMMALTHVAAAITSSLQTDELIQGLLDQVKTIIPYDTGTLWLRQGDRLTVRAAGGFEDSDQRIGLSVAIAESMLLLEMIDTSQPISVGDVRQDPRFTSLVEHQYLSWLGVPLLSKSEVVGVLAFEKAEPHFYTQDHIAAVVTFAGQAAVALVNATLFEDSTSRTVELAERSQRLALLNRLSGELSGSLDLMNILRVTTHEMRQALAGDAVLGLLFNTEGKALLHTEDPALEIAYPVEVPHCMIYERIRETLGVFLSENILREEELSPLREFLAARKTKAIMVVPLATGVDLQGLLIVISHTRRRFDMDEVELGRTIGNQAAVTIQNARLFEETQRLFAETQARSAELTSLYDLGVSISQVLDQDKLIDTVFENSVRMLQADAAGLSLQSGTDSLVVRFLDRSEKIGPITIERKGTSFSEYVIQTGAPFIVRDMEKERDRLPIQGVTIGDPVRSWLGVPLIVRGSIAGVLSVMSYQPNAFGNQQLRFLLQIGNQLAVAFDNARLFQTTEEYAADMAHRVAERTQELEQEHNRTQTLLDIITELSASLDLDLVLNRTLAVLNEAISAEHSLIMLVHPEEAALFLRASLGYTTPPPKGGQITRFKPNEGLAGWVVTMRQSALIPDLQQDERWMQRVDHPSEHRSAIAVPLMMGEEVLGALLLFHRQPNSFTDHQLTLVQATAKQIAVAINNAQLYNLIRDQAERLGDMLRTQHIETSRSQAMLEAVADGVLVTDANRIITLFNPSAERILDLQRQQVLGRNLDHFIGLFGKAGQSWVHTIRTWSDDPASYMPGDTYAEQIELDDRRVVSVHLSPVLLRNDFLGTVSIFRDITHLIEVDRLKSEFVATVSHELRTPMTSIKGYVEILLMGAAGQLTAQQTHFLEVVKSNTERLAVLVNDLLDISRIEAGRISLSMQPLDMHKVAERAIETIIRRSEDEGRPMQVELHRSPGIPPAYGDPERVQQILDNLVENAFQYTPANGKIEITVRMADGEIQTDVKDNGIGIMPEDQPRVFERFFRGEDPLVLATSGTGLGLSIVRHLVEMHNGRIWLESSGAPGLGSTFSFTLPIYESQGEELAGEQ